MKSIHAAVSLVFLIEQWRFLGVAWVLPTSGGFLTSTTTPLNKKQQQQQQQQPLRPSHKRNVVTRMDTLEAQIQPPDDDDDAHSSTPEKLWSYVFNLQKARKSGDIKTAKSLVHFLNSNQVLSNSEYQESLQEVLERSLTQALRLAGEAGDYRLVQHLVQAAIQFANGQPVLKPRIFGEALDALSQTHANVSKLKQLWNLVASTSASTFLSSPLSAFELNVMLKSLATRGRARACADLYRQHTHPVVAQEQGFTIIRPDAYTASTLLSILTDSIQKGQPLESPIAVSSFSDDETADVSALERSLRQLSYSSCWQWNFVMKEMFSTLRDSSQWNNHAYSALIKLQDKAQELIPGHENGPRIVMAIFDSMLSQGVPPDVVTCTLAIKAMGDFKSDPLSWKLAVHLLEQLKTDPRLPKPNEYSYSAAIVACARCHEYTKVLELLKEMRTGSNSKVMTSYVAPKPNTWVYNAVLSAIAATTDPSNKSRRRRDKSEYISTGDNNRYELALRLLDQMKYDSAHLGMDTLPDTVTYNTILAIRGPLTRSTTSDNNQDNVSPLIAQMKAENIPRDAITYRNAILACTEATLVIQLLELANDDIGQTQSKRRKVSTGGGKGGAHDMSYVYNVALSSRVLQANFKRFKKAFEMMQNNNVPATSETLSHLISVFGRSGKSQMLTDLLAVFHSDGKNDDTIEETIATATGISLSGMSHLRLESSHYVTAIEACLAANNLDGARNILSLMRDHGVAPTTECLQSFALAYARAAIREAKKKSRQKSPESRAMATSRAQNAFKITSALKDLSPFAMSTVAKACAATSQWEDARTILRSTHTALLASGAPLRRVEIDVVHGMHSSLIRECARQGNVTIALGYASDIQNFAAMARRTNPEAVGQPKKRTRNVVTSLRDLQTSSSSSSNVGMRAEDWVALIKSASDSGHWKVCVNTLQFLRPYIQRTNLDRIKGGDYSVLDLRYEQLAPALTAACICLEKSSQYAWGERVLDEWMAWSGRKPRPEAVLSTIRSLSTNGQGDEIKGLLARCIDGAASAKYMKKGVTYAEILYIGAITALHNSGMYDDADEVFISAISQGYLPFEFGKREEGNVHVIDLHGMNVAMAHSAVRVAMRRLANEKGKSQSVNPQDMMIITGRGRNSALRMRPVLRPEVQRMLLEEFYPPLNTVSVPGNTGALMVYDVDISAWQKHQEEQKGVRMLALAAILKTASTDRIQVIATKLGASSNS